MSRHRNRHARSQFPTSAPPDGRPETPSQKQGDPLTDIQTLLANGKIEDALHRMDTVPAWIKRSPEFMLMRAAAMMEYGDVDEGGRILREMERKQPRFTPLYLPLAGWYMMQEWPAHAFRAIRKTASYSGYDAEAREMAQAFTDGATEMIDSLAAHLNLPFEKAEQAAWYNEQSQLATLDNNLIEVERQAREALKIAPQWNAPRNNHAHALYLLGKCSEAVAETENVLASDPANVHGLNNLIAFHAGLGNVKQAEEYAKRLFALSENMDDASFDVDIVISALALVEDTGRLWELAQRYARQPEERLLSYSWQCLGVAAARLGHFKEAKKLLERGIEDQMEGKSTLEKVTAALKSGTGKLVWPPMFPGIENFVSERFLSEWADIAEKVQDNKPTPSYQRRIEAILARHPYALYVFKRMLWNEETSALGASALAMFNKPEADAEILRFAFSDCGDNESRMEAVMMLVEAGRYSPEEPVEFWNADRGKWHDVQMFSQQIGDVEYEIKPQTGDLITRARQAKDPQEAIALLRRAVEDDPTCAIALHNLGVILAQQGQEDEGHKWMRRAVEVDPTYTFGHANLGLVEAQGGNKEAALDHLMQVNKAKVITPDTVVVSNLAYMLIAIQDQDIELARRHFDTASEINPDHPILKHFEERLNLAETFSDTLGFIRDFQKQSANRFHRKMLNTPLTAEMNLEACLSMMTKDTLVGTCRFWKTIAYGKKQEMVGRLTARILDTDILGEIIKDLDKKELDALRWVLDGGGWRPWEEFTQKFGDDMDESPHWNYHDPESIPGRLKMVGFLYTGKLEGQEAAFLPADVRGLLTNALM